MTWDQLRGEIRKQASNSAAWQSDLKHILQIIDYAEENEIAPESVANATTSNLRAIVPLARRAVQWGDTERLETLFDWAATLPYKDLRIKVSPSKRERIKVHREGEQGDDRYLIEVSETQLEQFEKMFRDKYIFEIDGGD